MNRMLENVTHCTMFELVQDWELLLEMFMAGGSCEFIKLGLVMSSSRLLRPGLVGYLQLIMRHAHCNGGSLCIGASYPEPVVKANAMNSSQNFLIE